MLILYGIKNCDTVKKARRWLEEHELDYTFHDFRQDGLDCDQLSDWAGQLGWEALLNRRSTTWRQLDENQRANLDQQAAVSLMAAHPTLIRRPVLDTGQQLVIGFSKDNYLKLLK
ncbi:MAG: ArsC family reductase [Thiohalophilus sp.]|uniref:ArsC family reductase n=1 Tax=Thiohalophilus sp. TaxID=3028392 RepID=UPI0028709D24|nr:ArsC family reductase [Thiohalophilus sp.]MDR9435266.1 ArsC family reductase [Thiohalophilus sp.]